MKTDAPFFERGGVLTFLKTNTQLKIWFDDVLEVTWIYEDKSVSEICGMRDQLSGLQFQTPNGRVDTVSTHYRYQTGGFFVFEHLRRFDKLSYFLGCNGWYFGTGGLMIIFRICDE